MRNGIVRLAHRVIQWMRPRQDQQATIDTLADRLADANRRESLHRAEYVERAAELIEARQMAGAGPWLVAESRSSVDARGRLRESDPLISQGAFGDIDLALQNVEWRREVNLSWLEFSRWGIQQVILISRLYYIKNPIIRRLVNVVAAYVFARGVEVTSPDPDAAEVLKRFFEDNKQTLGHRALVELEKRRLYDGNLFFVFFPERTNKGSVQIRTIDATEVQDIVCDPDDADTPWFYRRGWSARIFDVATGSTKTEKQEAWYPALGYEPEAANRPEFINGVPVKWDNPVLHDKVGAVAKWHFGCPEIYPALAWAKAARQFLEACASVKQALSQIAMTLSTKGGQAGVEGAKQQLQTSIGPATSLWDGNPTAVSGSIFAAGTGTTLQAFKTQGAGGDPEEVRRFMLMCCMVVGVPETFLADVSTGNLATATSLDRPTETGFLERQEAWVDVLDRIATYVLKISAGAPSGLLREGLTKRGIEGEVLIRSCVRKETANKTRSVPAIEIRTVEGKRIMYEAGQPLAPKTIVIAVNFPAIREGDIPALVKATVEAATMGDARGGFHGIDEKATVTKLYDLLGFENGAELAEQQYPEGEYDPDRTQEVESDEEPLPADPTRESDRSFLDRVIYHEGRARARESQFEHHGT